MPWSDAVDVIRDHLVKIFTPSGSGTGFLLWNSSTTGFVAIATAAHVINHAHYWEQPIRVSHFKSNKTKLIKVDSRAIFLDEARDAAVMLFSREELPFPEEPLPLAPEERMLRVGKSIGWIGFPAINQSEACFFKGAISAQLWEEKAYLVDGVAINGVSGGPAFWLFGEKEESIHIIGFVSAYMPNRATGETLPGLSIVRDVSHFHQEVSSFNSFEEAQQKETIPEAAPSQEVEIDGETSETTEAT